MKKFIPYQSGKICVQSIGRSKSKVLMLLHGFCEDHTIWNHQFRALKGVRILAMDLPGFGKSTTLHTTPSIDAYAHAVAHVLTTLGIQQVVLLGHSLGGYVTLRFASLFPHFLRGFGLVNSHPMADTSERKELRNRTIQLVESGGQKAFVRQLISGLFAPNYMDAHADVVQEMILRSATFPAEGIIFAAHAMRDREDQTEVVRTAQVPVGFILGEQDQLIPQDVLDAFVHLPTLAHVHLIPKIGHMAMLEAAEETTLAIQEFVDECALLVR